MPLARLRRSRLRRPVLPPATRQATQAPVTPEAVEAELERLEKLLAEEEELAEFTPSKPLPADVPVAWPSDI